jgi:hypothetical protein
MSTDKMLFYVAIFAILCVTILVSHCTYQTAHCKQEAIKASVPIENIKSLCQFDK